MKGTKRITWEQILQFTEGGYHIFRNEIGEFPLSKAFKSPLRVKDSHPSFGIHPYNGIYFYNDLSTGDRGTALQFVMKKYNISMSEAIQKIASDFGMIQEVTIHSPVIIDWKAPVFEEREIHISFSPKKFSKEDHGYWNAYHLEESFLKQNNVYSVDKLSIGRKMVPLRGEELRFCYLANDIDKCKVLRINVKKEDKWRTNVPGTYLWFRNGIGECSQLVISKSVKDALCLRSLGICALATQNESVACIERNREWIDGYLPEVYINMGSDKQGYLVSKECTDKFGYKWYNTPNSLLELGVNDFAEFYKYNRDEAINHLEEKGLL